jgi:hypothetical protein
MPNPKEKLAGAKRVGPDYVRTTGLPGLPVFAGRTTLNSGSVSVTVSTAAVRSNSIFRLATVVSTVGLGHNSGGNIVVNSVVHNTSFALARAVGVACPFPEIATWEIVNT